MNTHFLSLGSKNRIRMVARAASLVIIMQLGLVGCADTQWERALYQGAVYGNDQCQLKRKPADAPCTELLRYDRYEQARARAKNESPQSLRPDPIEETQQ